MTRRDFIKTALAGLAALVLPKRKAEATCYSVVTREDVEALLARPSLGCKPLEPSKWRYISPSGWIEPAESSWSLCNAYGECIGARGRLEMHRTVSPLYATDEMIADWEAMGWKPKGEEER